MARPLHDLGDRIDFAQLVAGIPSGKSEHPYNDGGNLEVIARLSGRHTFRMRAKGGSPLILGTYPEMDDIGARTEAMKVRGWMKANPTLPLAAYKTANAAPVVAHAAVPTFREYALLVINKKCKFKSDKTRNDWLRMINGCELQTMMVNGVEQEIGERAADEVYLRVLADMPLDTITKHDLARALEPYWLSKPSVAREHRKNAFKIFKLAISGFGEIACMEGRSNVAEKHILEDLLPDGQLERGSVKGRHPSLPYTRMPQFWQELRAIDTMASKWLQMTILTGLRSKESRHLDDSQIAGSDWERGAKRFVITADKATGKKIMKNGLDADIPITPMMQQIIDEMHALRVEEGRTDETLLFYGTKKGGMQAADNMRKLMQSTMGYNGTNGKPLAGPHGFRQTLKAFCMDETDHSETTSEFCLHHIEGSEARNAYATGAMWRKRKACLLEWEAFVTGKRMLNADREAAEKNSLPVAA